MIPPTKVLRDNDACTWGYSVHSPVGLPLTHLHRVEVNDWARPARELRPEPIETLPLKSTKRFRAFEQPNCFLSMVLTATLFFTVRQRVRNRNWSPTQTPYQFFVRFHT